MPWSAAASIAGSLISSSMQSDAGDSQAAAAQAAANTSAEASKYAANLQKEMFDISRSDLAPYREVGTNALNRLSDLMGVTSQPMTYQQWMDKNYKNGVPGAYVNPQGSAQPQTNQGITKDQILGVMNNYPGANVTPMILDMISQQSQQNQTFAPSMSANDLQSQYQNYVDQQKAIQQSPEYGSLAKSFSLADFQKDPGYEFRLGEGEKALNRAAAAKGRYDSGATLKALNQYNQNFASNEFGNAFNRDTTNKTNLYNRLAGLSGTGQTAANQIGSLGSNYANQVGGLAMNAADAQGNAMMTGANARASSYAGIGNSLGGLGSSLGKIGNLFSGGNSGGYWDGSGGYIPMDTTGSWNGASF